MYTNLPKRVVLQGERLALRPLETAVTHGDILFIPMRAETLHLFIEDTPVPFGNLSCDTDRDNVKAYLAGEITELGLLPTTHLTLDDNGQVFLKQQHIGDFASPLIQTLCFAFLKGAMNLAAFQQTLAHGDVTALETYFAEL